MAYITSRLANSVDYTFYTRGANGINQVTDVITVNGGADVINKSTLVTPSGVVTEIPDEKLDRLKSHPVFKQHLEAGHVVIQTTEREAEKIAKDEQNDLNKDNAKQLTKKDYKKANKKAPKTNK